MKHCYIIIPFLIFFNFSLFAQQKSPLNPIKSVNSTLTTVEGCSVFTNPSNYSCGSSFTYVAPLNNSSEYTNPAGASLGCMGDVPNQIWFIITINSGTNLNFNFNNSNSVDVDGIIWGPIQNNNVANACATTTSQPLACDFGFDPSVTLSLNDVQIGQKYVMLVTNGFAATRK